MVAPLVEALFAHEARHAVSFHTPGHKGTLHPQDLTELEGLGDLLGPSGPIREAQALAAEAFGADETFFLVNGSTVGNQALVMAACPPGGKLLLSRASHQSVLAGLVLSGGIPVFLEPEWEPTLGIPIGITPETVQNAFLEHPDLAAVHLTSPTYWGVASDLGAIAEIVHSHGIPLLVDEAHGPHFHFHPSLPPSAMEAGADGAVQSTHKLLPSLTQSSMLHLKGNRLSSERVLDLLRLLQSSSPSYPLLASLDQARERMQQSGNAELERTLSFAEKARARLAGIPGLSAWAPKNFSFDRTKLVIETGRLCSGDEFLDELEARGLILELASPNGILALLSVDTKEGEVERLVEALGEIARNHPLRPLQVVSPPPPLSMVLSPREAFYGPFEEVSLEDAVGRVAAEAVTPYPPGIPLLFPGARITLAIAEALKPSKESIRVLTQTLL